MTRTRERSTSPDLTSGSKKLKTCHGSTNGASGASGCDTIQDHTSSQFAPELLDHTTIAKLRSGYLNNQPFKFAVVEKLFQDDLLKKVKDECVSELSFSQKETDIYKVRFALSVQQLIDHKRRCGLTRLTRPATWPHSTTLQHPKYRFFPTF